MGMGAAFTLGGSYFFEDSWAFDVSYNYATVKKTFYYSDLNFTTINGSETYKGTITTNSRQRITTQSLMFGISKHF